LELIYIGIKPFIRTTDRFQETNSISKAIQATIVIHCREAFDEVFEILEEEKSPDLFGIFHCFTGTYEQALQSISYNMKLGMVEWLPLKRKNRSFLNQIDLKHIVLETDSPILLHSFSRKRNESSYLLNVIDKLAIIYNLQQKKLQLLRPKIRDFRYLK
jgi:TatD DNase family protein